jgi:predicted nucleic acid-binding Zn finger protein/dephospho-CoA kinase
MNQALFQFHKRASITVLTGRMGSGKTSTTAKLADKYDLVVPTDFSRPKQPDGTYKEVTRPDKLKIRKEKREQILKASEAGKKVLVEGHPPGVVKLFREDLKKVDKVIEIPISLTESFRRVLKRAEEDPDERDVMIEMDAAVSNNQKYDDYLKRIKDAGLKVETLKKLAAVVAAHPDVAAKVDQHLTPSTPNRWGGFGKNLRSKAFLEAFKNDERTTAAQKRSAELRHKHLTSKEPGIKVQGEHGQYVVKYHPDLERHTCSCNDFVYNRSAKGGDCKHITTVKSDPMVKAAARILGYQEVASSMTKTGFVARMLQAGMHGRLAENARRRGQVAKAVGDAYEQNFPKGRGIVGTSWHNAKEVAHEAVPWASYL